MARKTIKALEEQVANLTAEKDSHAKNWLKQRDRADAAERIRDQIAKDNSDLKERLHSSETKIARLEGYMDRVREDDAVNDPMVEIDGPEGKRLVSKRYPSPRCEGGTSFNDLMLHESGHGREKRRHWTSY
jgi:hypothetical protein